MGSQTSQAAAGGSAGPLLRPNLCVATDFMLLLLSWKGEAGTSQLIASQMQEFPEGVGVAGYRWKVSVSIVVGRQGS